MPSSASLTILGGLLPIRPHPPLQGQGQPIGAPFRSLTRLSQRCTSSGNLRRRRCQEHHIHVGQSLLQTRTVDHKRGTRTTHGHQEEFGLEPHLLRWRTATRDIRNGLPVSMHGLQHAGRRRSKKPHKDRHERRHAHVVKRDRLCASGEALLHRTLHKIGRRVERLRKELPVVQEQVVSSNECQVKTSWRGPAVTKMKARWYGARSDEEEELHEKGPARQLI